MSDMIGGQEWTGSQTACSWMILGDEEEGKGEGGKEGGNSLVVV